MLVETIQFARTNPGTRSVVVAQTMGIARTYMNDMLGMLTSDGEVVEVVPAKGEINLSNGSQIYVKSGKSPDQLRGYCFDWVANMTGNSEIEYILRPALMFSKYGVYKAEK